MRKIQLKRGEPAVYLRPRFCASGTGSATITFEAGRIVKCGCWLHKFLESFGYKQVSWTEWTEFNPAQTGEKNGR